MGWGVGGMAQQEQGNAFNTRGFIRDEDGKQQLVVDVPIEVPRRIYEEAAKEQRISEDADDIEDYLLSAVSLELSFFIDGELLN